MSWITMLLVPLTGAKISFIGHADIPPQDPTNGDDDDIIIEEEEIENGDKNGDDDDIIIEEEEIENGDENGDDDDIIIEEEEIENGDENGDDDDIIIEEEKIINGDDSVYFDLCDVNPNLPFCPNTGNDNTPIIKDTGSTSTTKVIYDEGLGTVVDMGHSDDTSTVIKVSTQGQANVIDTAIDSGVTSAGAGEESELTVEVQTEEEKQQDIIVDRVRSFGFQTG